MLVQKVGVEPTRVLSPLDFESSASAYSATPAVTEIRNQKEEKQKSVRLQKSVNFPISK